MKKKILANLSQAHGIFVVITLIFGLTFIKITPPMWGVDETEHFSRVYQISTGNFLEDKIAGGYGGSLPAPIVDLYNQTKYDLLHMPSPTKNINDYTKYKALEKKPLNTEKKILNFTGAGVYSPLAYAAPVAGVTVAKALDPTLGGAIFGARAATLFLYIAIVTAALYILRTSRIRWVIFSTALLPMSIVQASVVSVDSPVIAFSVLFFALVYKLAKAKECVTYKYVLLLSLTACILTLTKPNYFIITLIAATLLPRFRSRSRGVITGFVFLTIATLPALIWNKLAYGIETVVGSVQRGPSVHTSLHDQFIYIMAHPLVYMLTMLRSFIRLDWLYSSVALINFNFVHMPSLILVIAMLTIMLATLYSNHTSASKGQASLMLIVALLASIGVITSLYLSFNQVGANIVQGVQGRYFIPIIPLLAVGAARFLPLKLEASPKAFTITLTTACFINLAVTAALYHAYTF